MHCYLAGPMRSIAAFNFPAFADATARLREAGHTVFSPAERDIEVGFDPTGMAGTDEELTEVGFSLRDALGADLAWITATAEAVVVLPGWERSSGARCEAATALALGLPVVPLEVAVTEPPWQWGEHGLTITSVPDPSEGTGWPVTDGEVRVVNETTGGEKGSKLQRFDLLPVGPLTQLAEHFGRGARKYEDRNWERGYNWSLSYAALLRHLMAFWDGEDIDAETGSPHIIAVAWHALALAEFARTHPALDDRPGSLAHLPHTVPERPLDNGAMRVMPIECKRVDL